MGNGNTAIDYIQNKFPISSPTSAQTVFYSCGDNNQYIF